MREHETVRCGRGGKGREIGRKKSSRGQILSFVFGCFFSPFSGMYYLLRPPTKVAEHVVSPLRTNGVVEADVVTHLFLNWEQIRNVNTLLLEKLAERLPVDSADTDALATLVADTPVAVADLFVATVRVLWRMLAASVKGC